MIKVTRFITWALNYCCVISSCLISELYKAGSKVDLSTWILSIEYLGFILHSPERA